MSLIDIFDRCGDTRSLTLINFKWKCMCVLTTYITYAYYIVD